MLIGALCMSHSPLLESVPPPADIHQEYKTAMQRVRQMVDAAAPDLIVIFHPDHVNGFFYRLMPPFCVGIAGESVGDYGTTAGPLGIPETAANSLASSLLAQGVDVAISHKMLVDHGATQPIELLAEEGSTLPFIPVFINAIAAPRPTWSRARALGTAVGEWAMSRTERVLIVASGGLSHDPPLGGLADANPEQRLRLIEGGPLPFVQRVERQQRTAAEGLKMAAGTSLLRPINPEWDKRLLEDFVTQKLDTLDAIGDDELTEISGRGAHEIRTWIAALAACQALGPYAASVEFYAPVKEWITGMGVLWATAHSDRP